MFVSRGISRYGVWRFNSGLSTRFTNNRNVHRTTFQYSYAHYSPDAAHHVDSTSIIQERLVSRCLESENSSMCSRSVSEAA
jgi:hypothetical protein